MALKPGRPTGRTLTHVDRMKQQLTADEGEMRLNVRMPKAEYQRLKRYAFEQGMNVSDVVRKALKKYMAD